jgi:hypothetical protein
MSSLVPWTVITRVPVLSHSVRCHDWLGPIDGNTAFKAAQVKFEPSGEIVDALVKGTHYVVTNPAHANKT